MPVEIVPQEVSKRFIDAEINRIRKSLYLDLDERLCDASNLFIQILSGIAKLRNIRFVNVPPYMQPHSGPVDWNEMILYCATVC